jgi:hypothetical protein
MNEERYTISSLLSRLIEIEERTSKFYASSRIEDDRVLPNYFQIFCKEHQETATKIEVTKRETIVEFALESISGVDVERCLNEIDDTMLSEQIPTLDKAIRIEEKIFQLYANVAEKIAHISGEANQLLSNSNKKARKRLDILMRSKKG